ncbi:MAG: hypothetical protein SGPRY_011702, partial [Prymnesium sp.]
MNGRRRPGLESRRESPAWSRAQAALSESEAPTAAMKLAGHPSYCSAQMLTTPTRQGTGRLSRPSRALLRETIPHWRRMMSRHQHSRKIYSVTLLRSLCLRFWNHICTCLESIPSCSASWFRTVKVGKESALKIVSSSALASSDGVHLGRLALLMRAGKAEP